MKKTKRKNGRVKQKKKVQPIPKGFHSVTPYLAITGAAQALEWYKKAFGAKELARQEGPEGKLIHARMKIGDSLVMLSDIFPGAIHKDPCELGAASVTLHIYTRNVDAVWSSTVEAGAKVNMLLSDTFWGERYGQLTDPFGHAWSPSMVIPMSSEEMERKRQEAMKMFEQGQHPGTKPDTP